MLSLKRKNKRKQKKEWNELRASKTTSIEQLMNIDNSIWYCTQGDKGEKGIVEYDCIKDKIISVIPYPKKFLPIEFHSCCNYEHLIYIVNAKYGYLIIFNTKLKIFVAAVDIPKFGGGTTSVIINQQLHVFNGSENYGQTLVFDFVTRKLTTNRDYNHELKAVIYEHVIFDDVHGIIRFGGFDWNGNTFLDHLLISTLVTNDNMDQEFICLNGENAKSKLKNGINGAGYILWNNYLIMFGGKTKDGHIDNISMINISGDENDVGWRILDIKCPQQSSYNAVLMPDDMVHLIRVGGDDNPQHFSIHLSKILGPLYQKEIAEEKDDQEQSTICRLRTENEKLREVNMQQNVEMKSMQAMIDKLLNNQTKLQQEIARLKICNDEYMNENHRLGNECKELKLALNKATKKTMTDLSNYLEWSSDDVVAWICDLDNARYIKYKEKLTNAFRNEGVDGKTMKHLDKQELRGFGIDSLIHRASIYEHIQTLVNSHAEQNNEILHQMEQNEEGKNVTPYI